MKPDLSPYLGQWVTVVVDRPLGQPHPRRPDFIYPLNYGELPGTLSGDGQPIDAYLLGWNEPLTEASGSVVAIIERTDDREDKLVVAREGTSWTEKTIQMAVHFQEQYFQSRIIMAQLEAENNRPETHEI